VVEGKLSWTGPIRTYILQSETKHDPEVGKRATLVGSCSHGTGLAPVDHSVCGFYKEFYNDTQNEVYIASRLPKVYDFRSRFMYRNTRLGVVGDIVTETSRKASGTFLHDRIFEPLGMTRIRTENAGLPNDGNVPTGYSVMDDGPLSVWILPVLIDGSPQGGAGYVRSTTRDMMIWVKAMIKAETSYMCHAGALRKASSKRNPVRKIPFIRSAHRPKIQGKSALKVSYPLG